MGIRCYCPNGHKLNLKEHLAGQRGICPKCGLSFTIPNPEAQTQSPSPQPTTQPSPPVTSQLSPPPLPPGKVSPEIDEPFDVDRVPTLEPDPTVIEIENDPGELPVIVEPKLRNTTSLRALSKKHARIATTFMLGVVALAMIIVFVLVLVLF